MNSALETNYKVRSKSEVIKEELANAIRYLQCDSELLA